MLRASPPRSLFRCSLSLLPDFFLLLSHFTESLSLSRSFAATAASEARAANSRIQDPRFVRSFFVRWMCPLFSVPLSILSAAQAKSSLSISTACFRPRRLSSFLKLYVFIRLSFYPSLHCSYSIVTTLTTSALMVFYYSSILRDVASAVRTLKSRRCRTGRIAYSGTHFTSRRRCAASRIHNSI